MSLMPLILVNSRLFAQIPRHHLSSVGRVLFALVPKTLFMGVIRCICCKSLWQVTAQVTRPCWNTKWFSRGLRITTVHTCLPSNEGTASGHRLRPSQVCRVLGSVGAYRGLSPSPGPGVDAQGTARCSQGLSRPPCSWASCFSQPGRTVPADITLLQPHGCEQTRRRNRLHGTHRRQQRAPKPKDAVSF